MPLLVEIGPQLDTLIIPEDLTEAVDGMREANREMRGAWSGYISYLDDPELEFDGKSARPHIRKISKAWYDFKKAHGSFNKTVKARLQ